MLNKLIEFPLFKDDKKAHVNLNDLQKQQIKSFIAKVDSKEYNFVNNPCLCGNRDTSLDIVVAQKDRFGIPCVNVLCKKCGLIRLKDRLDDSSTAGFYMNEYRDIYVGKEDASDAFFNAQAQRGQTFLNLVATHVDIKEIENIFEIGCGAGGILYPFYQREKKVSGCDFGEKYLKYGQEKGLNLYQGEINETQTAKNSQDLIILSHVMEHFNTPLETMSEIIEYIKPEKYLLVEVPGVFDIPKTYFNPILYFQNAHVYNYYFYYLKIFFETLGMEVIYGDERSTFILKKPLAWSKKKDLVVYDKELSRWAIKVEQSLKKFYIQDLLKLNSYYYKLLAVNILNLLGVKSIVKKFLGK